MHRVEKKSSKLVYDGYLKIENAEFEEEGRGKIERNILVRQDASAILLFDRIKQKFIMVRQFRAPVHGIADNPFILEIPAGVIEEGDTPVSTITREAMEEVGYEVENVKLVSTYFTTAGYSTEKCHIFYAEIDERLKTGKGGGAENENEEVFIEEVDVKEAINMISRGEIIDGKTIIAVQWFQLNMINKFG